MKLLLAFCGELIPYKEMLKDTLKLANERSSFAIGAAPILEAYGRNWEADHFEAELKAKRAKALYHLIDVPDTTEKEWLEFAEKQATREKGRKQIERMLGR